MCTNIAISDWQIKVNMPKFHNFMHKDYIQIYVQSTVVLIASTPSMECFSQSWSFQNLISIYIELRPTNNIGSLLTQGKWIVYVD